MHERLRRLVAGLRDDWTREALQNLLRDHSAIGRGFVSRDEFLARWHWKRVDDVLNMGSEGRDPERAIVQFVADTLRAEVSDG